MKYKDIIAPFALLFLMGLFLFIWDIGDYYLHVHHVVRVIDGDTIEIETGERVRYLAINTPETGDNYTECYGYEAYQRNKELVLGKDVFLYSDVQDKDKYGRLLRYVYLKDDTFVNALLVKEGYAEVEVYDGQVVDEKRLGDIYDGLLFAIPNAVGLWSECK